MDLVIDMDELINNESSNEIDIHGTIIKYFGFRTSNFFR